ncbi:calcium/sodium antiporter [Trujillonella humicola]|uniref:calcium/sodium antiporter n=1 Tax=Trujillonella humicola TaxID=3383699 RepID=UPI0039065929
MGVTVLSVLGGLVLLALGGELLVRGAVRLAERLGVSPLLIGLTVVGFGTSTPELVTSVQAALVGSPGIAVGNIVGSNVLNILVILGLAALIWPLAVPPAALRRDGVAVVATAALLGLIGWLWTLDRLAGALLIGLLGAYLYASWRQERTSEHPPGGHTAAFDKAEAHEGLDPALVPGAVRAPGRPAHRAADRVVPTLLALGGLLLLVVGARLLVGGSIDLARELGISEGVIGLTVVALGTSMPELVTSVVAAVRRHTEVALGNVLGSCVYNTLGIGGVTALVAPTDVPDEMLRFDIPVMVGVSVLLLVLLYTRLALQRWEGALLLAGYAAYVWVLWP